MEAGEIKIKVAEASIGEWVLQKVGEYGSSPVYSFKNKCVEIRFLPGCSWFDLEWVGKQLSYTGGDNLKKTAVLFGDITPEDEPKEA